MAAVSSPWDYLIITASNKEQAEAYESQLDLRRRLGLLEGIRRSLVIADPEGRRIGSGGSTIHCLLSVLGQELGQNPSDLGDRGKWGQALASLRVLIIHAGGDSRGLPAYGPCGKIFIPVPGEGDSAINMTMFDRQLPVFMNLPACPEGVGQIVVAAGDILLNFEPQEVKFAAGGVTGFGCHATQQQASRHGVFCATGSGPVRLFLQKPTPAQQVLHGAVDHYGQVILDVGVMNLDANAALRLLEMSGAALDGGRLVLTGGIGAAIGEHGLDFYREICCALGGSGSRELFLDSARTSGSKLDQPLLEHIYDSLHSLPFHVQLLPWCEFLHFGASRQLLSSGSSLLRSDLGLSHLDAPLSVNNVLSDGAGIVGGNAWVEGCRLSCTLTLGGENLAVGLDVHEPLTLPRGACLDVIPGQARDGQPTSFVRCYGIGDTFKSTLEHGATFCNRPLSQWLAEVGCSTDDLWPEDTPGRKRTLWTARLFPAEPCLSNARRWLWMHDPGRAASEEKLAYRTADRYSLAEIAARTDHHAFHSRRREIRGHGIRRSMRRVFRLSSKFSCDDLAMLLHDAADPVQIVRELLQEARHHYCGQGLEVLVFSRIVHTLGSALEKLDSQGDGVAGMVGQLATSLEPVQKAWLDEAGISLPGPDGLSAWIERLKVAAFAHMGRVIVHGAGKDQARPVSRVRSDEIVWGRAPARLDLGGGWSDTPPYALEHGGCVINAAVTLNGQPPIQAYARVCPERLVRITSIDQGSRLEIRTMEDLLDYRKATSDFGLAKAAIALSGLSPEYAHWPENISLEDMLEGFGGGIELTTLSAVPKGSGLGTSSILGAVILAVVQKMMGNDLSAQDLFHGVLRLEQALTTGGGWQDQIGAVAGGVKVVSSEPGLIPQARVHYVPQDVLDCRTNGGCSLLYYTGITRLARNILQKVVGNYLDRDRKSLSTLEQIRNLPPKIVQAMSGKNLPEFGRLVDVAWRLNNQLDPDSSNPQIEALLERLRPHVFGAKLLGAGGGGFLLIISKSAWDSDQIRQMLQSNPPNDRARFFDFAVSSRGLSVTTC